MCGTEWSPRPSTGGCTTISLNSGPLFCKGRHCAHNMECWGYTINWTGA